MRGLPVKGSLVRLTPTHPEPTGNKKGKKPTKSDLDLLVIKAINSAFHTHVQGIIKACAQKPKPK